MTIFRRIVAVSSTAALVLIASDARAQQSFGDGQAMTQFQRAIDGYAFQHRQVQRRVGETSDQPVMAAAMRTARPSPVDGAIFTPLVSAAFRARIMTALKTGCDLPGKGSNFVVPHPNDDAGAAVAIPGCVAAVLPRIPAELEYRAAGVTLILVDTHANLVVDVVLHAAFP